MSKISIDAYDDTALVELQSAHQDLFKSLEKAISNYQLAWNDPQMRKLLEALQTKNRST